MEFEYPHETSVPKSDLSTSKQVTLSHALQMVENMYRYAR